MTQGLQNKTCMCGVARFRKESPWDCHHPCQPPFPNDTSPSFAGNLKRLPKLCHFTTLGFFGGVFSTSYKTDRNCRKYTTKKTVVLILPTIKRYRVFCGVINITTGHSSHPSLQLGGGRRGNCVRHSDHPSSQLWRAPCLYWTYSSVVLLVTGHHPLVC